MSVQARFPTRAIFTKSFLPPVSLFLKLFLGLNATTEHRSGVSPEFVAYLLSYKVTFLRNRSFYSDLIGTFVAVWKVK